MTSGIGSSWPSPDMNARTIGPPRVAEGSPASLTVLIHDVSSAAAAATSPVPSSEPSSTITHAAGGSVCASIDRTSRARFSASFLAGVTVAYESTPSTSRRYGRRPRTGLAVAHGSGDEGLEPDLQHENRQEKA